MIMDMLNIEKPIFDRQTAAENIAVLDKWVAETTDKLNLFAEKVVRTLGIQSDTLDSVNTDTTYRLTQDATDGHKITFRDSDGRTNTITIPDKDTTYTAGTNVAISNANVISATDTKYTAGTNVAISNTNVISATDTNTTYTLSVSGNNIVLTPSSGTGNTITVPYATSAGNADTVDGYHEGNFIHSYPWWSTSESHTVNDLRRGATFAYQASHSAPTTGTIVSFDCSTNTSYTLQMMGQYSGTNLYFRNRNGDKGTWSDWVSVINSGNISSQSVSYATTSATAHVVDQQMSAIHGNEVCIGAGSNSTLWLNYRRVYNGGAGTAITMYYLGAGTAGGYSDLSLKSLYSTGRVYYYDSSYGNASIMAQSGFLILLGTEKTNAGITCRSGSALGTYIPISASKFEVVSSKRIKENIQDLTEDEAKKLLDVDVVSFDYIEDAGGEKGCRGVIAEDVVDIIPSVVNIPEGYDPDVPLEDCMYNVPTVDYSRFVPYLIKMVQMQQKEIEELKEKLS